MAGGRLHPARRCVVEPGVVRGGGAKTAFHRARGQNDCPDPEGRRQNPRHLPSGEGRYGRQLNGWFGAARLLTRRGDREGNVGSTAREDASPHQTAPQPFARKYYGRKRCAPRLSPQSITHRQKQTCRRGGRSYSCRAMRTLSTKGSIQTFLILTVIAGLVSAQFQVTYGKTATAELSTANRLIDSGIPAAASAQKNPLPMTATTVAAGRSLYQKNCTFCHGYDGTAVRNLSASPAAYWWRATARCPSCRA